MKDMGYGVFFNGSIGKKIACREASIGERKISDFKKIWREEIILKRILYFNGKYK